MTKSRREQYDEAKRLLEEINYELKTQPLTEAQRKKLQLHAASLAGVLLHPWFPGILDKTVDNGCDSALGHSAGMGRQL
jgi:hypothetical protein